MAEAERAQERLRNQMDTWRTVGVLPLPKRDGALERELLGSNTASFQKCIVANVATFSADSAAKEPEN